MLVAQGDRAGALAAYRRGSPSASARPRDPANTQWQRTSRSAMRRSATCWRPRATGRRRSRPTGGLAIAETLARAIPPTPNGSATSRSAMTGSATCWCPGRRAARFAAYRRGSPSPRRSPARPRQYQWQRDLIVSYVKMAEAEPTAARAQLSRALDIARTLQSEGRLAPTDAWVIDDLTQRLGGTKE